MQRVGKGRKNIDMQSWGSEEKYRYAESREREEKYREEGK